MDTEVFDLRHDVDFDTILSAFFQLFGFIFIDKSLKMGRINDHGWNILRYFRHRNQFRSDSNYTAL